MNLLQFKNYLENKLLILDGATGTELQKKGLPLGIAPEAWVLDNPEALIDLQQEYIKSGSDAVYSFTFGANRLKLSQYGLQNSVADINRKLVEISRKAVGREQFVAGNISSLGVFIRPFGELDFEEAVTIYKEQVQGLVAGGIDFFVIETISDIQEARAALLAVKESCQLPVCVSMTFDADGRTLTGTDPVTALITLQALGADAIGCNCSVGPQAMVEFIRQMRPYSKVPLLAKPNAGLPKLIDNRTVFDMNPSEFAEWGQVLVEAGASLIGGCCGTTPDFIAQLSLEVKNKKPAPVKPNNYSALTSARKTVFVGGSNPVTIIGERINPTGKKQLQASLREGSMAEVRRLATEQITKGATVLDVNVGMPGINEAEVMVKAVEVLAVIADTPLSIDSSTVDVIEQALRIYPGRAIINSISAEKTKLEQLLPIAAKYGAMFILLPLNEAGIPKTAVERYELIKLVYNEALKFGFKKDDIVVDGLVMTVSSDQTAAVECLNVIEWCKQEFGVGTVIGLSNVSFGLPERSCLNSAFLAMAIGKGLTMAIANPSLDTIMQTKMAADVLVNKDSNCQRYITYFTAAPKEGLSVIEKEEVSIEKQIYNSVVSGNKEGIIPLLQKAISENYQVNKIVDEQLIPAINKVGELYENKSYFLPQLIQSAETMKIAFEYLEPYLRNESNSDQKAKTRVVIATVKGDIHDIGKNIVVLMLKNYGFEVLDLGKDVDAPSIVQAAKDFNAKIIGLSALMTTTMTEMKEVINLARKEGMTCKFMVGGAVVTQEYADEIGADGYSEDANSAVKLAQRLSE